MPEPQQCTSTAELIVDERIVGWLRCDEPAGHDVERPFWLAINGRHYDVAPRGQRNEKPMYEAGTAHRAELVWTDDDEGVEISTALPEALDLADGTRDDIEPNPADVLPVVVSLSVPGLCGIEGCVYLDGHRPPMVHSWHPGAQRVDL